MSSEHTRPVIRPGNSEKNAGEQELRDLMAGFGELWVSPQRAGCWALVAFALGMLVMTAIHFTASTPLR